MIIVVETFMIFDYDGDDNFDHDVVHDVHDDDDIGVGIDDDDDDDDRMELVIGYGWSHHLLSITVRRHITPSPDTCLYIIHVYVLYMPIVYLSLIHI